MIIPIIKFRVYNGTAFKLKLYTRFNSVLDCIISDIENDKCERGYFVDYLSFSNFRLKVRYIRVLHWIDENRVNRFNFFNLYRLFDTDSKNYIVSEINKLRRI